jgi:hypothetical protein
LQEELNDETSVKEEFEDQDTTDKYEGRWANSTVEKRICRMLHLFLENSRFHITIRIGEILFYYF